MVYTKKVLHLEKIFSLPMLSPLMHLQHSHHHSLCHQAKQSKFFCLLLSSRSCFPQLCCLLFSVPVAGKSHLSLQKPYSILRQGTRTLLVLPSHR